MKRRFFPLGLAVVLVCLGGSRCLAGNSLPSVDSVLAKWEAASQTCKILDAKVTEWRYDAVFGGKEPTISQGRFYYEAPNIGRYEIGESSRGAGFDRAPAEVLIWNGKETLWIDRKRLICEKYSTEEIESLLGKGRIVSQPPLHQEGGFWSFFPALARTLAYHLQGPRQFIPLVVGVRASEVRERFDVTIAAKGKDILVKAVPKQPSDKTEIREIDILLNGSTYFTSAVQQISRNGKDRRVVALDDLKLNKKPGDQDELLAPNLFGFSVRKNSLLPPSPAK
jgi:hypothetical protein